MSKTQKNVKKKEPEKNGEGRVLLGVNVAEEKPSPAVAEKAQPAPLTLRERLRKTTQTIKSASSLRATIADAKDCQTDPEVVSGFVELIRQCDELATYLLSQKMPAREASDLWLYDMDWREQQDQLLQWAKRDKNEKAQSILDGMEAFNENPLLRDFLREVVERFETPLRWINTYGGLKRFLDEIVREGTASVVSRPKNFPEKGVLIPQGHSSIGYLPKRGNKVAESGWQFVKDAEGRAQGNQDKLEALKAKSTGLTPTMISNFAKGETGIMFLRLGGTQAVLLEAFKPAKSGDISVKVVGSVGVDDDKLPNTTALWIEESQRPDSGGNSKWAWICKAIDEWMSKEGNSPPAKKTRSSSRA